MAALAVVGAILMGCAGEDMANEAPQAKNGNKVIQTTTISLGGSAGTRALDANGKKTFAVGDQIAIYYKNTSDELQLANSAALTANDISSDGKTATITVEMTDPKPESQLRYIYPAAMGKTDIGPAEEIENTINYEELSNAQDGTLATLASKFDLAVYDGKLTSNGGLPSSATLKNLLAIAEFTFKDYTGQKDINSLITSLTIIQMQGDKSLTINRTAAAGPIYVAMSPCSDEDISIIATDGTNSYEKTATAKSLAANTMTPVTMKMQKVVDLSKLTADYEAQDGQVLTGTLDGSTKPYKISIADGATVTLNNATIDGFDPPKYTIDDIDGGQTMMQTDPLGLLDLLNSMNENLPKYLWAGLNCIGDATIILADGTTNTVRGFYKDYPGIHIPKGKTLTIQGSTGKLISNSNGTGISQNCGSGAGIGGGVNIDCGHIRIEGGDITTTSFLSAGIGGGGLERNATQRPSCDGITITGGKIEVTAVGLNNGAAGIGSGTYGDCGDISISGGTINSDGNDGAAIGSGWSGSCGDIIISGCKIYAASGATCIGCGKSDGTIGVSCGDITITTDITEVTAFWKRMRAAFPFGDIEGKNGLRQCGKVMFGNREVDIDNWRNTVGESYGGLKITVTNEFSKWILTPGT